MYRQSSFSACAKVRTAVEVNSVPLSLTTMRGLPRVSMRTFSSRTTRLPEIEASGIAARHSFVTSSMMFSTRNLPPPASWSCTKSIDQRLFGPSGAGIGVRATAIRRRDLRRRTASPSSP